jgi:hypothetical protein
MITLSPALQSIAAAAVNNAEYWSLVIGTLGANRRVIASKGGTPFRDCALTGAMTTSGGTLTGIGVASDTVVYEAADLATPGTLRVTHATDATLYLEGTLGLSGQDFNLTENPTTSNGFGIGTIAIQAPAALPDAGGGGESPPIGTALATLSLVNTSGSIVAADFIPPMFGHPFRKGDVPAGAYPRFELADTTEVPYTMFNKATWSDGSLKFASFLLRVPSTVAGSGSLAVTVKASESAPATSSSRSLADLSSGSADLKVEVVGLDNLSGTWTSSLNQGVTDNDDVITFGDGVVGKVWRIRQQFMQSAANHGQLECYWYVAALQDASGNLYGLRYLGRVSQPWFDVDTPAKAYRSFSSVLVKNGASTLRDVWASHASPKPMTYSGGINLGVAAHGFRTYSLFRASGTTLPTPLSANTSYRVSYNNTNANVFGVIPVNSSSDVSLSGTASGDAQVQAYPYLPHFCSIFTAGPEGMWDYLQAGGSVADEATVRVQHDAAYWQTTGVVPTYESVVPTAQASFDYEPNYMGPSRSAINGTGEDPSLGVMPDWHVKHLLLQSAAAERTSRASGLSAGNWPGQLYHSTNKTLKPANGGTYTGMPSGSSSFRWAPGIATAGFTEPASGPYLSGVDEADHSHKPAWAYYPYLMTGEPQYLDLVLESANYALSYEYSVPFTANAAGSVGRNSTVNGTTYNGSTLLHPSLRSAAWATRELACAAGIVPDIAPQCAAYKTYFTDAVNTTFAAITDFVANVAPPFLRTAGFICFENMPFTQPWMHGYQMQAIALAAKMTENANAMTYLNHLVKWPAYIRSTFGTYYVPAFEVMVRSGQTGADPYVTSSAGMSFYGIALSWDNATDTFTAGANNANYTPNNGDVVAFDGIGYNGSVPPGLTAVTQYYIVNASGNNFQLALAPGGAPVSVTGTGSGTGMFFYQNPPPSGSIQGTPNADGYAANILGGLKLAKAAGATVDQATINALESLCASVNFTTLPKYRFADAF